MSAASPRDPLGVDLDGGSSPSTVTASQWRPFAAAAYFVIATLALIHPLYSLVGNHVEPRVAGLPFSLVYILGWILANTAVLAWMYSARVIDASEADPNQVARHDA